jgi:hypothetical protein
MTNRFLVLVAAAAVLGCSTTSPTVDSTDGRDTVPGFSFAWETTTLESGGPGSYANIRNLLESRNPILALYREDLTHDAVVDFFVDLTGSPEIALPILYHADRADISLSLVFSLAWVESRYSPVTVNRNAASTDRGLFQLNSRTFRNLTEEDFFHPDTNTYHGIDYLAWCIEHTSTDWEAVAAYNGGLSRVRAGRIPQTTLVYVERIRQFRTRLDDRFREYILQEFPLHNT